MLRIFSLQSGRLVCTSEEGVPHGHAELPQALWYDLYDPTAEERAFVNGKAHVDVPARADIEEIEISSRLYHEADTDYMTIIAMAKTGTGDALGKTPLMFILKGETLVTVRFAVLRPFELVIERAARNGETGSTGEQVMMTLIEAFVDRLADALETLGDGIDSVSRNVFRSKIGSSKAHRDLEATIEQVGRHGDQLGLVRESLVSFNRMIGYHEGAGAHEPRAPDSHARITTIQRDVAALSDHANYLGSKIAFLLDATLGLINLEQNQIIKIFSIAAVCLMPPTLVASIYGMNFKHIPELDWVLGYPMALSLMVVTGIAPVIYFRKRGWL